jgi:quinol monooxygenase YgiN
VKEYYLLILVTILSITSFYSQDSNDLFVRLVKIEIFPTALSEFTAILNEQMNTAILLESGVLEYRVVNEKDNPHLFTLIETYRD